MVASDQMILEQYEEVVTVELESPLVAASGLEEPSLETHHAEGLYTARTLVQARQEVPVRVLNVSLQDQILARRSPLSHYEPVTWVTPLDATGLRMQEASGLCEQLQSVVTMVRPTSVTKSLESWRN
jgi:hypothetical protein